MPCVRQPSLRHPRSKLKRGRRRWSGVFDLARCRMEGNLATCLRHQVDITLDGDLQDPSIDLDSPRQHAVSFACYPHDLAFRLPAIAMVSGSYVLMEWSCGELVRISTAVS